MPSENRKNAANGTMWSELLTTFEDVAGDRNDRVMVLTGAGDAFCSGADLGDAAKFPTPAPAVGAVVRPGDQGPVVIHGRCDSVALG